MRINPVKLSFVLIAGLACATALLSCASNHKYDSSARTYRSVGEPLAAYDVQYSRGPVGSPMRINGAGTTGLMNHIEDVGVVELGCRPALDEELWVVVKGDRAVQQARTPAGESWADDVPGSGAMVCRVPRDDQQGTIDVPLPLTHTDVHASISAYIASVRVTQQFHNPYAGKIEAAYLFPLPDDAAVTGFVMTIGSRHIRGVVREREEAQKIYTDAKHQGYVASLLTQERPNIFMQAVANIEPGKQIDVDITYFHTLAYDDGWYEFVFPMVIGPRFNPPAGMARNATGIGATAHGEPGLSAQHTETQYLRPHERSGHDISLAVDIEAGTDVEQIKCRSHHTEITHQGSSRVHVALRSDDTLPNKDFVLRYRVAGDRIKTSLLVQGGAGLSLAGGAQDDGWREDAVGAQRAPDGGHLALMIYPPRESGSDPAWRAPLEMIFVVDRSGSMKGQPLAQVKAALDHALARLQPQDAFDIVEFSDAASLYSPRLMAATPNAIREARRYVSNMQSGGGTMMLEGMKAALRLPNDGGRLRVVAFLTDGYIGNEAQVLDEMEEMLGPARVFSFGVGSSPNRFLLNAMARLGGGAVAYLGPRDDGGAVMDAYFDRISQPVLRDIEIDWCGAKVRDVVPARLPELWAGRPIAVLASFEGPPPREVRVRGRLRGGALGPFGSELVTTTTQLNDEGTGRTGALAAVWARRRMAALADKLITHPRSGDIPRQMASIALKHGLMSQYTAFVAVDASTRTAGAYGTTVNVAVPVPEGVKYETTVPE